MVADFEGSLERAPEELALLEVPEPDGAEVFEVPVGAEVFEVPEEARALCSINLWNSLV